MIRLFIYGTLQRGQRNSHWLRGQTFLGEAQTLPRYRLYDAGTYPCLVADLRNGVAVRGELWEVDEALLPKLDELEGAPDLYGRETVSLRGVAAPVVAYFYRKDVTGFADCGSVWPREAGGTVSDD